MVADDKVAKGSRASTAMIMTYFSWNITVSPPQGFRLVGYFFLDYRSEEINFVADGEPCFASLCSSLIWIQSLLPGFIRELLCASMPGEGLIPISPQIMGFVQHFYFALESLNVSNNSTRMLCAVLGLSELWHWYHICWCSWTHFLIS